MLSRLSVIVSLLVALPPVSTSAQTLPNGVACGDVDQSSIILWARNDVAGTLTFEYTTDPAFGGILGTLTADVVEPLAPVEVEAAGLTEATQYYYRATDAGGNTSQGQFRTPALLGFNGLRFGVSGDWRGELNPYPSIANIPDRDLDFFIALGDTIYADVPSVDFPEPQARSLADFRVKHNEVYKRRFGQGSWIDARASTPLLAVIDDHEVANDFAGGAPVDSDSRFDDTVDLINETQLFQNGLQAFQEYNPLRDEVYGDTGDSRTAGKRKLYRFRTFGQDATVIILDARSFRDEPLSSTAFATTDQFLAASFDASRTMLGAIQLEQLKTDLLRCVDLGITWKFVCVPEPIQNMGPVLADDRFEGYAAERSEVLGFIDSNDIDNVVFVSADIHGTLVNNLVYRPSATARTRQTTAFEITTGSVAYDAPFGPTVVEFVPVIGGLFDVLDRTGERDLVEAFADLLLGAFDYPAIGLAFTPVNARLLFGKYLSINTYGWTEFEIDAVTQCLTVTTYGIDWYTADQLMTDPEAITNRSPQVVSRFRVQPRLDRSLPDSPPPCFHTPPLCGAFGSVASLGLPLPLLSWPRRRSRRRERCEFLSRRSSLTIIIR